MWSTGLQCHHHDCPSGQARRKSHLFLRKSLREASFASLSASSAASSTSFADKAAVCTLLPAHTPTKVNSPRIHEKKKKRCCGTPNKTTVASNKVQSPTRRVSGSIPDITRSTLRYMRHHLSCFRLLYRTPLRNSAYSCTAKIYERSP